jgi:glycosyltransferase involved in cell wall biosynthesis
MEPLQLSMISSVVTLPQRVPSHVNGTAAGHFTKAAQLEVLIVDHTAELGGAEIALLRLIAALDREVFRPSVLLFSDGPLVARLQALNVRVTVIPLSPKLLGTSRNGLAGMLSRPAGFFHLGQFLIRVVRYIRSGPFDIVHTTSLKADLLGGMAARLARKPLLWHVHDRISADYLPSWVAKGFRVLARRLPHFVVANSDATKATLQPFPAGRICTVHPGLPSDFANGSKQSHENVAESAPVVGIVGRISRTKGQDIFIRACATVAASFPQTRFVIIGGALFGQDEFEREVRGLVAELKLRNVEFTGFCNDVALRMRALSIVVHASPVPEPFGQVVVEGMALGKPVVATAAGGVPEIVVDGECGYLVPPGDANALAGRICDLLRDPQKASAMGKRGQERAARLFSASQSARKMEAIYRTLRHGSVS